MTSACCHLAARALGLDDAAVLLAVESSLSFLAAFDRVPLDTDRRDANRAEFRTLVASVLRSLPSCCRHAYTAAIREALHATPTTARPLVPTDHTNA